MKVTEKLKLLLFIHKHILKCHLCNSWYSNNFHIFLVIIFTRTFWGSRTTISKCSASSEEQQNLKSYTRCYNSVITNGIEFFFLRSSWFSNHVCITTEVMENQANDVTFPKLHNKCRWEIWAFRYISSLKTPLRLRNKVSCQSNALSHVHTASFRPHRRSKWTRSNVRNCCEQPKYCVDIWDRWDGRLIVKELQCFCAIFSKLFGWGCLR